MQLAGWLCSAQWSGDIDKAREFGLELGAMGESLESVAEQALIKLLFALSDLESHGADTPQLANVREQLVSAVEHLSRVAPRFHFDTEVSAAFAKSCAACRRDKKTYI